jgi:hypothetical protein
MYKIIKDRVKVYTTNSIRKEWSGTDTEYQRSRRNTSKCRRCSCTVHGRSSHDPLRCRSRLTHPIRLGIPAASSQVLGSRSHTSNPRASSRPREQCKLSPLWPPSVSRASTCLDHCSYSDKQFAGMQRLRTQGSKRMRRWYDRKRPCWSTRPRETSHWR